MNIDNKPIKNIINTPGIEGKEKKPEMPEDWKGFIVGKYFVYKFTNIGKDHVGAHKELIEDVEDLLQAQKEKWHKYAQEQYAMGQSDAMRAQQVTEVNQLEDISNTLNRIENLLREILNYLRG